MLSGLYNFISKLAASKRINAKEAMAYGKQVRRLMVQTSTDFHILVYEFGETSVRNLF